ncbi:MAG: hypothetical protein M0R38_04105 [Bacteroidia bacterium]|nr:hypothetical protein [Bacteroidia bacterium]
MIFESPVVNRLTKNYSFDAACMHSNQKNIFYFLMFSYAVLVLFNLAFIPIAWIDEIMDLDPAMRFVEGHGYNSNLWSYKGSEKLFLANLPLRNMPFVVMGYLFGADIFWIRLPHVLFFLGACFFLFKLLKFYSNETVAWIVLLFFVFDKGIYESLRAVRCEMQELLYISASLYFTFIKKRIFLSVLLSGLLAIVHPATWVISGLIALKNIFAVKKFQSKILAIVLYLLPTMIWLYVIKLDFQGVVTQLFAAGMDHTEIAQGLNILGAHFYKRFNIYFSSQPWVWLGVLVAHLIALRNLIREKDYLSFIFISHSLFWLFLLAPNYRYNPSLLLFSYLLIAKEIARIKWQFSWAKVLVGVLLITQMLPFAAINIMGILQREERNPYQVQQWLSQQVSLKGRTLLCGESIGLYWLHSRIDKSGKLNFCAPNYPHKFDFSKYDQIVLFTSEDIALSPFAEYVIPIKFPQITSLLSKSGSPTYNGMKLYNVSPEQLTEYCLKIRHGDPW